MPELVYSTEVSETSGNSNTATQILEGVRFVEIIYFINRLKLASSHNSVFGCTLANMEILKEVKCGFSSVIIFKCNMCNSTISVPTHDPQSPSVMNINSRAVAGAMSIGAGFSHLEEFCASMGVPCMAPMTYSKHHDIVCDGWEQAAAAQMKSAVVEEAELARKRGDVDDRGVPLLTVVVDGTWCKRSYKTKYDALSGAVAIVGYETKKVLYMAVANKYCYVCARATDKDNVKPHTCYKNYQGSSSSMESTLIVQGFLESETEHQVIYAKVIGDGDSSVYKKILEARPYKNVTVEKIECKNHLLRNCRKKLTNLTENTALGNCSLRKRVGNKIGKLLGGVKKAVAFRKAECRDHQSKITQLRCDIENGPSHIFGEHLHCKELGYFCPGEKEGEENLVPALIRSGLYANIQSIMNSLARHSRSLIVDVDNNCVEQYNASVAKFSGAKRINYATRRSYQGRCAAAVVSHNTKKPHYLLHKTLHNGISPNKTAKSLEMKRERLLKKERQRRGASKKCRRTALKISLARCFEDKDYGPQCQVPDLPENTYKEEENKFLKSLEKTDDERNRIERETILQAGSGEWLETRRKMLTASNFGKVCRMKPTTSCKNNVKSIIYSSDILQVPALEHGRKCEALAIKQLENQEGVHIIRSGLFIDKQYPFIGATPDGLIGSNTIVEIKCPASAYGKDLRETMKEGKLKYLRFSDDKFNSVVLNKKHEYFYQVQGQLHVTQRDVCLFAVWTSSETELTVLKIEKDDTFWEDKMENKLVTFYKHCMLPELVDPRHTRNMDIRDPLYITEALLKKKQDKMLKSSKNTSSSSKQLVQNEVNH